MSKIHRKKLRDLFWFLIYNGFRNMAYMLFAVALFKVQRSTGEGRLPYFERCKMAYNSEDVLGLFGVCINVE